MIKIMSKTAKSMRKIMKKGNTNYEVQLAMCNVKIRQSKVLGNIRKYVRAENRLQTGK